MSAPASLREEVLGALREEPSTVRQLSERTGRSKSQVRRALTALSDAGEIDEAYGQSQAGERGTHGLVIVWFAR